LGKFLSFDIERRHPFVRAAKLFDLL
jgi:hypothetical protein